MPASATVAAITPPVPAPVAQPGSRVFRIGWLSYDAPSAAADPGIKDFQQGLRDLGYSEGKNFVIEARYAGGATERLADLAGEFSRLQLDVIVTSGELAALAAKRATRAIPVVATEIAQDPVRAGLAASLNRPGGNITGLATQSDELWQKRLGDLKGVVPKLSRVAVLWNPSNPGNGYCLEEIKAVAPAVALQVVDLEVKDASTLEAAFARMAAESPEAVVTCWDSVTLANAGKIGDFAVKRHMPILAPLREYVQAGGLMSIGVNLPAHRRRAAYYVDKIFKGNKPADLPFEQPNAFEMVINLKTAKALGVTVPPGMMVLADDLVQ
jgi:putative ABC transport system substrate-binding protein